MRQTLQSPKTAILHYTAPPVIGGVEGVIQAHCQVFQQFGFPVAVIAGRGDADDLTPGTEFYEIKELDTQHPQVLAISAVLEEGKIPSSFEPFTEQMERILTPILSQYDNLIVHNVFTKHFNIPAAVCVNKWDIHPATTERIEKKVQRDGAQVVGRIRYDPGVTHAQLKVRTVVETGSPAKQDIDRIWNQMQKMEVKNGITWNVS